MMSIVILVPVLNRPHRVQPLLENITQVTVNPHRVLFIATRGDRAEINALEESGADYILHGERVGFSNYAKKINLGYRSSHEAFIFTGADDLLFHENWDVHAMLGFADVRTGVVGTNDLGNPRVLAGEHSTHSLVSRRYADEYGTIEHKGEVYAEVYHHLYVDDEFVATAKHRNAWAFARDSHVEHLHPHVGKGELDKTYLQGFKQVKQDQRRFKARSRLWQT